MNQRVDRQHEKDEENDENGDHDDHLPSAFAGRTRGRRIGRTALVSGQEKVQDSGTGFGRDGLVEVVDETSTVHESRERLARTRQLTTQLLRLLGDPGRDLGAETQIPQVGAEVGGRQDDGPARAVGILVHQRRLVAKPLVGFGHDARDRRGHRDLSVAMDEGPGGARPRRFASPARGAQRSRCARPGAVRTRRGPSERGLPFRTAPRRAGGGREATRWRRPPRGTERVRPRRRGVPGFASPGRSCSRRTRSPGRRACSRRSRRSSSSTSARTLRILEGWGSRSLSGWVFIVFCSAAPVIATRVPHEVLMAMMRLIH